MKPIVSFFLLLHAVINDVNPAIAQPVESHVYKCRNTGNFPPNSPYQTNLMSALNSLPSNTANSGGYYYTSAGDKPNEQVFASALCAGYIAPKACEDCVKNKIPPLRKDCPNQKEAVAFLMNCMVRYSDSQFREKFDPWAWEHLSNPKTVAKVVDFDETLYKLVVRLSAEAAAGSRTLKYSSGSETYDYGRQTVYGRCNALLIWIRTCVINVSSL